jgi:chromosome partitioning protein
MLTLAIVSQKGGVGKTTLAIHLAEAAHAAGYVTVVIDLDPQATAATWGDWRDGEAPEVITTPPGRLTKTIEAAIATGAEVIVIDTAQCRHGSPRSCRRCRHHPCPGPCPCV